MESQMTLSLRCVVASVAALLAVMQVASAQDMRPQPGDVKAEEPQYSPYAGRQFPTKVLFGDTHLHTAVSVDAGTMNTVGQEDAFRFARGEEITTTHGLKARLSRPLDFIVVSDHAEMYGLMPQLKSGDPTVLGTDVGKRWYDQLTTGDDKVVFDTAMEIVRSLSGDVPPIDSPQAIRDAWRNYTALADRYNEPGRFSAIIGFEYTTKGANNLHRNVLFRGDSSDANQTVPYSQFDSKNPEDLWRHLDEFQQRTGAAVLAIPHNGNLSNGEMFSLRTDAGKRYTPELAQLRRKFEHIVEVTQIKGDGEAHPFLSPNDEFADYETWDKSNLNGTVAKEQDMLQYEYAREALKNGLLMEERLGVNPFKFGMIGSTDSHTSMATAEEENFFGKHSGVEPEPHRWEHIVIEAPTPEFTVYGWQQMAGGWAAVWATENTREAIFDAMTRRETYATTGSRMVVRFFGGWNFTESDTQTRLPAGAGYAKGVPMGGDLRGGVDGAAPNFLVAAAKDPYSGNLDRIQIIKGWLDADGETQEKVYDVVWSDDREPGDNGKLPPVGNTVDVANATWSNSIGSPELIGVWQDPDFDPDQRAVYYARVLEIPTPRWTAYEAKRFGIEMSDDVPMTTQERAYTSPIWYTP
ncbi:MAG: DUF3604 domain-containing protein [Woeseiaceae bacterium]